MTALPFIAVVVCAVWLLDRRDKRHQAERTRLLQLMLDERESMARRIHDERVAMEAARAQVTPDLTAMVAMLDRMAQRLQAPEWAVQEHRFATTEGAPAPQPALDDESWWAAQDVPKEELAEQLWAEELRTREPATD